MPDILLDGNSIVLFVLSLIVYKLFAIQEKCQNVELKMLMSRSSSRKTELVPFEWKSLIPYKGDFFRILVKFLCVCKKDTHTQRETGVMTIGKICKADLPKNWYKHENS